jgi:NADH dehydrogenase FAD-containing subunit
MSHILVPAGLVIWSTGLQTNPLVENLDKVSKTKKGLLTDAALHVLDDQGKPMPDAWAIGDCAIIKDGPAMPATAQVASQKADYVIKVVNKLAKGRKPDGQVFEWKNKGSLAYIGNWQALMQSGGKGKNMSGTAAWVTWRAAYFAMQLSWRNRLTVPFYWFLNWAFGRDVTRF